MYISQLKKIRYGTITSKSNLTENAVQSINQSISINATNHRISQSIKAFRQSHRHRQNKTAGYTVGCDYRLTQDRQSVCTATYPGQPQMSAE